METSHNKDMQGEFVRFLSPSLTLVFLDLSFFFISLGLAPDSITSVETK